LLRGQHADGSTQRLQLKVLQLDGVYEHWCDYSGLRPYMPNYAAGDAEGRGPGELDDAPAIDACGAGSLQELHLAAASGTHSPQMMNGKAMGEAGVKHMLKITNCQVGRSFPAREWRC
jgi:hypothetical protein